MRSKFDSFAEAAPARQAIAPAYTKHKIPEVDLPAEVSLGLYVCVWVWVWAWAWAWVVFGWVV